VRWRQSSLRVCHVKKGRNPKTKSLSHCLEGEQNHQEGTQGKENCRLVDQKLRRVGKRKKSRGSLMGEERSPKNSQKTGETDTRGTFTWGTTVHVVTPSRERNWSFFERPAKKGEGGSSLSRQSEMGKLFSAGKKWIKL